MKGTYGSEGCLQEVTHGCGRTLRPGVDIGDAGKLEKALGCGGSDDTGTTGCGDETTHDGSDLPADLAWHGVGLTKRSTPVTTAHRNNGELRENDGTTDGGCDFLGALDTETDVAVRVTDDDDGLEAGTLTGTGLLLDGLDLFER